jgi:putative ABC transport system permease protein
MHAYRLLLWLYPASFRAEYGEEMCAAFARRRASERAASVWASAVCDIVVNAAAAHIDLARQDLRWTLRGFQRAPGFALLAIGIAALGMGATTTAFTLLNHVLIRPLPFPGAEALVALYQTDHASGQPRDNVAPANLEDWRTMNRSFSSIGGYVAPIVPITLTGHGEPVRLNGIVADSSFFATLGVAPLAGRAFGGEDDTEAGTPFGVILSHRLAVALYQDAASAVGRAIRLDEQSPVVFGVMPPDFAVPSRIVDLWMPMRGVPAMARTRGNEIMSAIARLAPDVTLESARADMELVGRQLEDAYPEDNKGVGIGVVPLREVMSAQSWTSVVAVFMAACGLMLIACANLANLLFARAVARRREIAVRIAIGAGRERIVRQLLTESVVLAAAGAAAGLVIAVVARPLLAFLVPSALPMDPTPQMDWRVLAFAVVLAGTTTVVFGVAPSWLAARGANFTLLRTLTAVDRRSNRLRSGLVVAELAATVVLVVVVGLLLKSMWIVQAVDPGFRAEGVLTLETALPIVEPAPARRAFYQHVLTQARRLPGVVSAGYIGFLPMTWGAGNFLVATPGLEPTKWPPVHLRFITPDYFKTLRVPVLSGRDVREGDVQGAPLAAVISLSMVEKLWPGQDPIGRQVHLPFGSEALIKIPESRDVKDLVAWTVVGVVGDVAIRGLEAPSLPQLYLPADQLPNLLGFYAPKDLVVRATGDPLALAPALRRIVHEAKPQQAISGLRLLDDVVTDQTAVRRAQLVVLTAFAGISLLLAGVGIHGLLAFMVSLRVQEVGVRMALGAQRGDVLRMFVGQGLVLAVAGVALAVPLAYASARSMTSLLFGVLPGDVIVYATAILVAVATTLTGSLQPAIRAAGVDPTLTIRGE